MTPPARAPLARVAGARRLIAAALVVYGCGTDAPRPAETHAALNGVVARVGQVGISPELVETVALARGVSAREAADDLVSDALAAQGAEARGLDADPGVGWARRTALAARVPARLVDEAKTQGPPSDDELASVRVVHALVLRSATLREDDALPIARAIRQAVLEASSADDFIARAQAVPHLHAQVVAQEVGPFGPTGVDPSGSEIDPGFVAAAFALRSTQETSPIVVTPFGWHVLRLIERKRPESSPDTAEQEQAQLEAVVRMRTRSRLDALLRARHAAERVEFAVNADDLMSRAAAAADPTLRGPPAAEPTPRTAASP